MTQPTHEIGIRLVAVGAVAAWRIYQATKRRPTPQSTAVTVIVLALFASLLCEALALSISNTAVGRPYLPMAGQMICLSIMQCALCAYYAAGAPTPRTKRLLRYVIVLAALSDALIIVAALQIPPDVGLLDVTNDAAYRYYLLLVPPIMGTAAGYFAWRASRAAIGTLRGALLLAVASLWALSIGTIWLPFKYAHIRHGTSAPAWATAFFPALFVIAALAFVISIALVGIAHRSKQLRATVIAARDAVVMRRLRNDLQALLPGLTYQRTGFTPVLLRPHHARYGAYVEIRDRLLTLSPLLDAQHDEPDLNDTTTVARAITELRALRPLPTIGRRPPHPVLVGGSNDLAVILDLARKYRQERDK